MIEQTRDVAVNEESENSVKSPGRMAVFCSVVSCYCAMQLPGGGDVLSTMWWEADARSDDGAISAIGAEALAGWPLAMRAPEDAATELVNLVIGIETPS